MGVGWIPLKRALGHDLPVKRADVASAIDGAEGPLQRDPLRAVAVASYDERFVALARTLEFAIADV
ncbi:MAG TPA: hypothetical protein VGA02_08275 [Gemmatimonadales bacterium]